LKAFQEAHVHCNVPVSQGSLGVWVNNQRIAFKKNRRREDWKELLDEVGFVWSGAKTLSDDRKWRKQYDGLKAFKKENGQ
jgi:hypothetical protein